MRVVVVTSCTGEKSITHPRQLTLGDFRKGKEHIAARHADLEGSLTRAEDLYAGQQHVRLMRGVARFRTWAAGSAHRLDLHILSAGYGLVNADERLAPYEATFNGMSRGEAVAWAKTIGIPNAVRKVLEAPFDLALLLLGDRYLEACELPTDLNPGGLVLGVCSRAAAQRATAPTAIRWLPVGAADCRTFRAGLIALKGEIGARSLALLATRPDPVTVLAGLSSASLLSELSSATAESKRRRAEVVTRKDLDCIIAPSEEWQSESRKRSIRYFIPDWDDRVDPEYDFASDQHSGGVANWANEVYAHQMFSAPAYDGLLVSRIVTMKPKQKREQLDALGVHRFLRVPKAFPVMGDCGAFGYIKEKDPIFSTPEMVEYYTRLGFSSGVSIDHLIVPAFDHERQYRYDLTIANAEAFMVEHNRQRCQWEPIGAVQGWDAQTYAGAARRYVRMGYRHIALGGLVRSNTAEIVKIVSAVQAEVSPGTKVHLFGVARLRALETFKDLGVTSFDSASFLRKAWLRRPPELSWGERLVRRYSRAAGGEEFQGQASGVRGWSDAHRVAAPREILSLGTPET